MRLMFLSLFILLDADLIREALRHADLSLRKAALWMEMDESLLERQLKGDGHLSHKRLLMLPLGFWQWFGLLQAERYGLPREVKRAVPLTMVMLARKRMARVTLKMKQELKERKVS